MYLRGNIKHLHVQCQLNIAEHFCIGKAAKRVDAVASSLEAGAAPVQKWARYLAEHEHVNV